MTKSGGNFRLTKQHKTQHPTDRKPVLKYFQELSAQVYEYYRKYSSANISRIHFEKSQFIADYRAGLLRKEQVEEVAGQLDHSSRKKLYQDVLSSIDFLDPEEDLLNLLDILDPEETHFQDD
jgi:hypothetical protein